MTDVPENPAPPVTDSETASLLPLTEETLMQVEVKLRFTVGDARASLQELSSIQPGFVFETTTPVEKPVTIEVNGKAIGRGELVAVGDRIGVRVTEYRNDE